MKDQKTANRHIVEALALFFVLFFPRGTTLTDGIPDFLPLEEIGYSLFWRFPAFILILLLLEKPLPLRPKKDLAVLTITLSALCLTGFLVSLAAALTGFFPPGGAPPPGSISAWIAVILLSLSTGCLEEAYFRVYLPKRILELKQDSLWTAYLVPALVFALCHAHEGPWSVINALLAAFALSFIYIKSSSFAGIAFAHGLYNIFVYLTSALKR